LARIAELHEGEGFAALDLQHGEIGFGIGAYHFGFVFGAVGHRHRDLFHGAAPAWADDVVIGDDIAVRRDDEARTQRLAFAILRLRLVAAPLVEHVFERRAREGIVVCDLDPLAGGDVDHGRLQLGGQIGEAGRSSGARHHAGHPAVVVLGDLGTGGIAGRQRKRGSAHQQGTRQSIGISHRLHVLFFLYLASTG
jgi:hypothetical protein